MKKINTLSRIKFFFNKAIVLYLLSLSFTMQVRAKNVTHEKVLFKEEPRILIVTSEEYQREYSNLFSCHIGQIGYLNPGIELEDISDLQSVKELTFFDNKERSWAYELYNGMYVIVFCEDC